MARWKTIFAWLMVWQALAGRASWGQEVETIALTGQGVPAAGAHALLQGLLSADLNNHGVAAFVASVDGIGLDDQVLFLGDRSGRQVIAIAGEQAAGAPNGVRYSRFYSPMPHMQGLAPQLNDAGDVAFTGLLVGGRTSPPVTLGNSLGMWRWSSGGAELLVRAGDPAPASATGERFYFDFLMTNINQSGEVAFYGPSSDDELMTSSNYWATSAGVPTRIASAGGEIPGFPGQVFTGILNSIHPIHLDDLGRLNFEVNVASSKGTFTEIWREDNGVYELVVAPGDDATGEPGDITITRLYSTAFNDVGQSLFLAELDGAGVTDSTDSGLWIHNGDSLKKVVRFGDSAPGILGNFTFDFASPQMLGESGNAVFSAGLTDDGGATRHTSLWKYADDQLLLIAREGETAPGTEPGVLFEHQMTHDPEINAAGQVAFWSELSGAGVDDTNDLGYWAQNASGELKLIVREGDELEVAPGESRTIATLRQNLFSNDTWSDTSYFNDRGQLAFIATFTDGTEGLFISNLVAVPEPGALTLLSFGLAGVGLPWRQARRGRTLSG